MIGFFILVSKFTWVGVIACHIMTCDCLKPLLGTTRPGTGRLETTSSAHRWEHTAGNACAQPPSLLSGEAISTQPAALTFELPGSKIASTKSLRQSVRV